MCRGGVTMHCNVTRYSWYTAPGLADNEGTRKQYVYYWHWPLLDTEDTRYQVTAGGGCAGDHCSGGGLSWVEATDPCSLQWTADGLTTASAASLGTDIDIYAAQHLDQVEANV